MPAPRPNADDFVHLLWRRANQEHQWEQELVDIVADGTPYADVVDAIIALERARCKAQAQVYCQQAALVAALSRACVRCVGVESGLDGDGLSVIPGLRGCWERIAKRCLALCRRLTG